MVVSVDQGIYGKSEIEKSGEDSSDRSARSTVPDNNNPGITVSGPNPTLVCDISRNCESLFEWALVCAPVLVLKSI
jgi:hypothetical protein